MLRAAARRAPSSAFSSLLRPSASLSRRPCSSLDLDAYHRVANATIERLQDVYELCADDDPALAMDVEYAVRAGSRARS